MPFETVGRHRRVTLRDLVAYQERARAERRATLAELARDAISETQPTGVPSLKYLAEMESGLATRTRRPGSIVGGVRHPLPQCRPQPQCGPQPQCEQ